ncbi:hypothetical protein OF83DRAFT_1082313 [Amylostereum chailletii]|nr:hypothetical protein OF83DRAFT_1082313 [Amylostereum chailletii]
MGFFQRFLSLGSRKSKKSRRRAPAQTDTSRDDRRKQERELEAAASRLLRSSSAHFSVVSEVDYASLPPLPHPINSLNPTPVTSPTRSSSIQTRGRTYSVKILGERKVHACTEFPNANPPMHTPPRSSDDDESDGSTARRKVAPITPRDKNRLHGLRQDPSVASLLDMYDDDGHLDSKIFANTPKNKDNAYEGHAQVKRSGSTLRQLMGSPEPDFRDTTAEGDISWAERLLQGDDITETKSVMSAPSSVLETPKDTLFNEGRNVHSNVTISTDHEHSLNDSYNYPAISSMEVELSVSTEEKHNISVEHSKVPPTPDRPACEVFGFLLQKGKHQRPSTDLDRPLPAFPPASADSFTDNSSHSIPPAIPNHSDTYPPSPSHSHLQAADTSGSGSLEAPSTAGSLLDDPPQAATIMNGTPMAVTVASGSRIPRGPRGPRTSMIRPQNTASSQATTATYKSEATIKPSLIPTRDVLRSSTNSEVNAGEGDGYALPPFNKAQRRAASASSTKAMGVNSDSVSSRKAKSSRPTQSRDIQKENAPSNGVVSKDNAHPFGGLKSRLPVTPARSRSLFDPPHGSTPSPASSSELSPLGQQIMADLRKTRTRAREGERKKSRFADVITYQ